MLHSTIWEYAFNYMRVCIQTCSITGAYTTSLIHLWRAVLVCVTCLINMCDTPLLRVWRDSFIRVTWLMYMCNVLHSYVWHTPFIRVTCLMCLFAMTVLLRCSVAVLLYCSVGVLLCWPIHIFDMTRSRVWNDLSYVTWLIHSCDMTGARVWHDSFTCAACFMKCHVISYQITSYRHVDIYRL